MALSNTQREELLNLKQKGLTKQQAMARVFSKPSTTRPEGRFADVGEDLASSFTGVGEDLTQRGENIMEGFSAQRRGEQSPFETGAQIAGNVLGGAGDIAARGIQAVTTPFLKQSEEEAIMGKVGEAVESTGIPQAISETSPRTQRNITAGFGLFEGITAGVGGAAAKPATSRIGQMVNRFRGKESTKPTMNTPEQVFSQAESRLQQISKDPSLSPKAQEEAAKSALTLQEKYIGLTPDVKSRLQQMGPTKLQEYLDAAHMRNIDDTQPTPYTVGAQNVNDTLQKLDEELRNTGSQIGQARQKLASIEAPVDSVNRIEGAFTTEIDKLNLTIKNGEIVQKPGTVSKTDAQSDIRVLQELYKNLKVFKQSPTLQNAIDLRMAFDGKIKFGKAARDVSNSVDPVSRSVRKIIADEAAKVVGRENATELQRYSDFMEAYGDLKSYTDRAAGGEYLLRLVLSGRGGEAQKLLDTVKQYTGTDLLNDATAMKVATETLGNETQRNLFRQEVARAGFDVQSVLSGGPVGIIQTIGSRLLDYGIDAEEVLKKAAAGGGAATGAYLLMEENPEFAPVIGFAVASVNPQVRSELVRRTANLVDDATVVEMDNFNKVIRGGGVSWKADEVSFKPVEGMSQREVRNAYYDGLRVLEMDDSIMAAGDMTPGEIASFYDEVKNVKTNE